MIKVEKRKIYWLLIYPLATVTFVLLSVLFILLAKGYNIHFENGHIDFKKTGMFIVSSKPTGADIFLDSKLTSKKTIGFFSRKITRLSEGWYSLTIKKEGYHTWEKELRIFPEMVTWANYVLLFSKNPEIEEVDIKGGLVQSFPSLDKKANLILTKSSTGETLYRVNNESGEISALMETPKLSQAQRMSDIRIIDWSRDNRNILIAGSILGEVNYWVFNTDSGTLEDISTISSLKFDKLVFNTSDSDEVYTSLQGEIRSINLREKNISNVLKSQVLYFTPSFDGNVYYIKDGGKKRILYRGGDDFSGETEIIDSLPTSEVYEIKISKKDQNVAIKTSEDSAVYVVAKINDKNSLITMGKNISDFSWSPEGDRFYYKEERTLVVFEDEEYKKESREHLVQGSSNFKNIGWYDNHHLLAEEDGKVRIMDFDGTNQVVLGEAIKGSQIFYNPDNGNIYFFSLLGGEKTTFSKYKVNF